MSLNINIKQNYLLDFRRLISFVGLLEVSRNFEEIKVGQILNILVSNRDSIADICKILPRASYEMNVYGIKGSLYKISIKKILEKGSGELFPNI